MQPRFINVMKLGCYYSNKKENLILIHYKFKKITLSSSKFLFDLYVRKINILKQ